ncbi:phage portal protein [Clostridium baratii]|uniref:phage portal protein n=1 Tax=Clostridium baratii TaxID=1561 RepID=UPI0005F29A70|nr:phage portal protein [Clostridium baratii]KJU72476.1 portal protein [Clostridium baratii]
MEGKPVTSDIKAAIFYKEFAIQSCISIITNALVLSEFETFEKGKYVKKNNYYAFNIEPNKNQNATEFWMQVISNLVYDNECLIVQLEDQFYVADEFGHDEYVYYEDIYKNVVVRDYQLKDTFKESDVIYLKLNDDNIKSLIDGLYEDYSKLLGTSMSSYRKSNGRKGILEINGQAPLQGPSKEAFDKLMQEDFKKYLEADNAVLPLSNSYKFNESKASSNTKDSRDVRAVINDIIDFVAAAFHVPAGVIKGDIAGVEGQTDNFLMFCINPIARLITSEINRKVYGRKDYLERTYVKMNTQKIRNVDLEKLSKSADLLFRIGVNSIDDNLEMLGKEPLDLDWSKEHYVTKNYQSVLNPDLKGGGNNGTKNSKP